MAVLGFAFFVYALIAIGTLLYTLIRVRMQYWQRRGVPSQEPAFILGNLKDVGNKRHMCDALREVYTRFKGTGPFCGFFMLVEPVALVLDMDLAKNILIRDFNQFVERGTFFNERDDPLTAHLFNLEAPEWRKLRSKLSPTFTSGRMKQMFPLVVDVGNQCGRVLGKMLTEDNEVEMHELFARYTTDVIGSCIFGLECNSLEDPNAEFRAMNRTMFTKFRHSQFVHAFMHTFPKLARRLRMKEMGDNTTDYYFRLVRDTVEYREKNGIKRNDFMNMLIEMKNSGLADTKLNMYEITANSFLFFVAGFETSSTTMTFALYELAIQQDLQDRLRQEIRDVLERHNGEFTYEAMQAMEYLEQVINETLRKYPILPQLQRLALSDYQTDKPGYIIEKGTLAIIPIEAIQNDPDIFPEPEKFDPERFTPEQIKSRHPMSSIPFGDGPRNCIGMRFGKMQARIGLVSVLKDYKFTPCKRTPVPMVLNNKLPLMSPKAGLYLHADKI